MDSSVSPGRAERKRLLAMYRRSPDTAVRLRRHRRIHVICDKEIFHDPDRCRRIRHYPAAWGHRIEPHLLPKHSPKSNPIEGIWRHLHEEITRIHRCETMDQLPDLVFEWLEVRTPFEVEPYVHETGGPYETVFPIVWTHLVDAQVVIAALLHHCGHADKGSLWTHRSL